MSCFPTDRVKRDIERQIEVRLHDVVGDLYRRLGEAVERVSDRLQEDGAARLSLWGISARGQLASITLMAVMLSLWS